jgi:aminotransferase in exopolysaccharide biosynthesis
MRRALLRDTLDFIRDIYLSDKFIGLHEPAFNGNELSYVNEAINSTYVSSNGKFVDKFERNIEDYTKSPKAISCVNGTAALHAALYAAGVSSGDIVITQSLTFVATCNAISHMGAEPVFVDVSIDSFSLCPRALSLFLSDNAYKKENGAFLKENNKRISAVVPMHTFGHPADMDELSLVCKKWHLDLIEDAAESLGSFYKGIHTGTIGRFGALSFNGNKIITTGGGGMVLCSTLKDGLRVKHLTTTAKSPHPYEFFHNELGFNYRMPNLNAALGVAQLESLSTYLVSKRTLAIKYKKFFSGSEYKFVDEPIYAQSNFWLNAIICPSRSARNEFLKITNDEGVMTRPIWRLMNKLPMFSNCMSGDLSVSEFLESRVVNLPSSPYKKNGVLIE